MTPWAYEAGARYNYTPGGALWMRGRGLVCPGRLGLCGGATAGVRGKEEAGHVPGSGGGLGLGQGWRASEGELGTLRLAGEGSGLLGFGGKRAPTHHPTREEGLDVGASGSPWPSGHSSGPSQPLHRKPSLQRESRWQMPLHLPTRSVPSRYLPPPRPLLSASPFEQRPGLRPREGQGPMETCWPGRRWP